MHKLALAAGFGVAFFAGLFLSGNFLVAQEPRGTVINASGNMKAKLVPENIRVVIPLFAHSLSPAESLEMIRQRKDEARRRVLELSCEDESIQFARTSIESSGATLSTNAAQIRFLGQMGNNFDIDDLPVLVTARVDLIADWKLPAGADEIAMLEIAEQLVKDLSDPDISGKTQRPEFSPKVEEALRVIESNAGNYYSSASNVDVDKIRYGFVAVPSAQVQQEVISQAVQSAKSDAVIIASAMGFELGKPIIVSVSSNLTNSPTVNTVYGSRSRQDVLLATDDEIFSYSASDLEFAARVQMQYQVQ